jgi:5-methylcytosine-specific restriction endonuclease McrA
MALMTSHLGSAKWKRTRLVVLRRDGYLCAYCGNPANTVDHIVARVRGGSDNMDNLVAACARCNSSKRDKRKPFFLSPSSTPPAFIDISLPETQSTIPDSPFLRGIESAS